LPVCGKTLVGLGPKCSDAVNPAVNDDEPNNAKQLRAREICYHTITPCQWQAGYSM